MAGENILQPLVHLGWALAGAAFFVLAATAAVAAVAVLGSLVHRGRRHRTGRPPIR